MITYNTGVKTAFPVIDTCTMPEVVLHSGVSTCMLYVSAKHNFPGCDKKFERINFHDLLALLIM